MQDQAFLGPESGLAVPGRGRRRRPLHRHPVAARRPAPGRRRLGLPPEKVRLTLAGVGGAFGGREDLSMQVHACLLALHTGRPVKMVYDREESFFGHVHRHPARMRYEHGATRDGRLVYVRARIVLDGGAYASSSPAVVGNAATLGVGPYDVPNVAHRLLRRLHQQPAVRRDARLRRGAGRASPTRRRWTSWPTRSGIDPVELRLPQRACARATGQPTGQVIDSAAPVAELLQPAARRCRCRPTRPTARDLRALPGGVANTTHGEGVRRGVGYARRLKNVGFSEGFDDYSTARVRLEVDRRRAASSTVHTAAAEVGQGLVTVEQQIARTELGVDAGRRRARRTPRSARPARPRPRARPTSPAAR